MTPRRDPDIEHLRAAARANALENTRLRAALSAQLAASARDLARLEAEAESLRARVEFAEQARAAEAHERSALAAQLVAVEAELSVLKELLELREQQLYGQKSERQPSEKGARPPGENPRKKKPKEKQTGHGPTTQPDLPVVPVVDSLVGDALNCTHCGGTLEPLGTASEDAALVALEAQRIILEQHRRLKYQCPCCKTGVTTAPGPVKLIDGGRYALSFTLHVAFMKYMAHVPLARQVQMFRHGGLQVTTGALYDQVDALATALTATYQAIWKVIQAEAVLCADETPWAVLSNGYNPNERFYAWCAVGSQYVAYRLLDTRSAEGAKTILGAFAGTLMVDGLTSYPAAAKGEPGEAPKFVVANCHAHARRKFVDIKKAWPVESAYVVGLYKQLYAVEHEGYEPGADLAMLRQTKSKPLLDTLFAWAREQQKRPDVLPSSGLAKALAYLLNHEPGLRIYLDHPGVPIDNNAAERAMRAPVLGRKNHYGSRSHRGTTTAAILYTLVESAKRCGVSPLAYLEAAVTHALRKAGAVLLPDEFKRQLDALRVVPPPEAV